MAEMHIESINAVTLAVHDMSRSARFYTTLGFSVRYGGEHAAFTSLHAGSCYLNLIARPAGQISSKASDHSTTRITTTVVAAVSATMSVNLRRNVLGPTGVTSLRTSFSGVP